MISDELKAIILGALKLRAWDIADTTAAAEVPGWDSLNHINVISAVERHYGIRFNTVEVLRMDNVGDLQRLVDFKLSQRH